jgi:uncharacterized membrane protein
MTEPKKEEEIHQIFDITLILKGIHAIIEIIGGLLVYAVSAESVTRLVRFFIQGEISEDPRDAVANYFLRLARDFGGSSKAFAAFYLISHGVINGLVVIGLWKEKIWAYPVSLFVIGGFIIYQIYLLIVVGYSIWLVLFTVLDVLILWLVWHEYNILKKKKLGA